MLDVVAGVVSPKSVPDVGCGVGTWVAEWVGRGVVDAAGVDGEYVDRAALPVLDVTHPRLHEILMAQYTTPLTRRIAKRVVPAGLRASMKRATGR